MAEKGKEELKEKELKGVTGGKETGRYICPKCGYINAQRVSCSRCGALLVNVIRK